MRRPSVAVVTLAHGRHAHLEAQLEAFAASTVRPDLWVVAAMEDAEIGSIVSRARATSPIAEAMVTVGIPRSEGRLPLAAARNAAAGLAARSGLDVLVFLDVDCIPSPRLVERYAAACRAAIEGDRDRAPAVFSGAVHYLPPRRPDSARYVADDLRRSIPHPARPVAQDGECLREDNLQLFWSLSFAMLTDDWLAVGGFDEGYVGYGGEDTDFAMRVGERAGSLYWLGGAEAYHQYHDVEDPPRRHVGDIVRNSNRFHQQWGYFPMRGWLDAFAGEGLVRLSGRPPRWSLTTGVGMPSHSS